MAIKDKLLELAGVQEEICITISLNTHRTHPDSAVDPILLKDLLKEAANRLKNEYDKKRITPLLEKLKKIPEKINENYNLDSLHIFLSDKTEEIILITWPVAANQVHIDTHFNLSPILKAYNRTSEYMIMVLSQGGVQLYHAMNDTVLDEITENGFPIPETPFYAANMEERSNAPHMDNLLREYFNRVDKALVHMHNLNQLDCVVVCTEDNYSKLMQIADVPDVYTGHADIDYNHTETHQLVKLTWPIVKELQRKKREAAIAEVKEAISQAKVLTDLQEIYQAAIDGRGDLLVVYESFSQPVKMIDDRTFELADEPDAPGVDDDITDDIVREIFLKNGRVVFTCSDEIKELGDIVLKTRY